MTSAPLPRTVRVQVEDAASGFHCGVPSLDEFFARYACSNDERGIGRTYVLKRPPEAPATLPGVLGYYTLSMAAISAPLLAAVTLQKLPKYPIPAALLGRLAADERTRSSGLRVGETLLFDAFARVIAAAENVGCFGVVVDALDETAGRREPLAAEDVRGDGDGGADVRRRLNSRRTIARRGRDRQRIQARASTLIACPVVSESHRRRSRGFAMAVVQQGAES